MESFVEVFRIKRREGTNEWSVLVNEKIVSGLVKCEITGDTKGHSNEAGFSIQTKLNFNPTMTLPVAEPTEY